MSLTKGIQASPIPLADIYQRTPSSCKDIDNCRTLQDIVWSCLVTVFSCTWVAIHPNIPSPDVGRVKIALRRLGLFVGALIAPELVITWAMRQWLAARKVAMQHQSHGWSQTHGFFALMGGFILIQDHHAPFTLELDEIEQLSRDGDIDFPSIAEKEIEDKSKGDGFSKAFVLVQTIWFALQCIARAVQGLSITELEVATLAFVALNLVTYGLWWNKPLNVQCPHPVRSNSMTTILPSRVISSVVSPYYRQRTLSSLSFAENSDMTERSTTTTEKDPSNEGDPPTDEGSNTGGGEKEKESLKTWDKIKHVTRSTITVIHQFCRRRGIQVADNMLNKDMIHLGAKFVLVPFFIIGKPARERFWKTYDGPLTGREITVTSISAVFIATVFGAIHCIAWSFSFPSREEQTLWRVTSLIITCVPAFEIGLSIFFRVWFYDTGRSIPMSMFVFSLCLYTLAWVTLVLAFTSLRSLPFSAYQSVQWTTFIPHI
ncbi:hypothetical protein K439DRAFT_1636153 [Ramaria rubella]|nr:hypothetical protein K439DRAFT_1636153 [Ramaria rubella]